MRLDCPANVVTLANGELACHDGGGGAVAWVVAPEWTFQDLNTAEAASAFAAGFMIVGLFWAMGKGIGLVVGFVRRM